MKRLLPFLVALCSFLSVEAQNLNDFLYDLEGVRFEQLSNTEDGAFRYRLMVRQPVDHQNETKGYFYQQVIWEHRDFDKPILINTNGYAMWRGPSELKQLLGANFINVEHRYFGVSKPDSLDWKYLTLEQATADLHHINTIFRKVYQNNKWVSTGVSKGGQTSIYYRYFYPEDVDVSVPYVAPLNREYEDKRIYSFLANVGTAECRKKIKAFQLKLLKNKSKLLPLLKWFSKGKGYTFEYMGGVEAAFEYAVLEYPFSFWQSGSDCDNIPAKTADWDKQLEHFIDAVGLSLYSDNLVSYYAPHYYQAATQMGYYGFETKAFKGYLSALPRQPHAAFAPKNTNAAYNPSLNKKVHQWVKTNAHDMLYIYGGTDTWTATAVEVPAQVNSVKYVLSGKHHGNARIKNMEDTMRSSFIKELSKRLEVELRDIFKE